MSDFDPFAAEWITHAKSSQFSLIEKLFKLSQILEFPDLDISQYLEKIRIFQNELMDYTSEKKNPVYQVSMLNRYMFDILGFEGNMDDYYNPQNNFLNVVIDKRRGIPITLSILYIEVAKGINMNLKPVGFPGHFLVKYDEEIILDPFNGGNLLDLEDLQDMLDTSHPGLKVAPEFLKELEPEKILIRVLRNLKGSYTQSFNYNKAMQCIKMILGLEPESSEETRDSGIIQMRLLRYDLALDSFNKYLQMAPEADDVDDILEMIKQIKEKLIND